MTVVRSGSFDARAVHALSTKELDSVTSCEIWYLRIQVSGFEDRTEHQQRKRSPHRQQQSEHDYKRRNPFFPRGWRSSILDRSMVRSSGTGSTGLGRRDRANAQFRAGHEIE